MGRPPASRLAYEELVSPEDMAADARVVLDRVTGSDQSPSDQPPAADPESVASVDADDPAVERHEVRVSEAAARMAGALHLHTD